MFPFSCIIYFFYRYTSSVIPIGAMFAMTLWLGNTAYLYISVAFAQMLKAVSKYILHHSLIRTKDINTLV